MSNPPELPPPGSPTALRGPDRQSPWTPQLNEDQIAIWSGVGPDDWPENKPAEDQDTVEQIENTAAQECAHEAPGSETPPVVEDYTAADPATDERNNRAIGIWAGLSDAEDGAASAESTTSRSSDEETIAVRDDLSEADTVFEAPLRAQTDPGTLAGGVSIAVAASRAVLAIAPIVRGTPFQGLDQADMTDS